MSEWKWYKNEYGLKCRARRYVPGEDLAKIVCRDDHFPQEGSLILELDDGSKCLERANFLQECGYELIDPPKTLDPALAILAAGYLIANAILRVHDHDNYKPIKTTAEDAKRLYAALKEAQ